MRRRCSARISTSSTACGRHPRTSRPNAIAKALRRFLLLRSSVVTLGTRSSKGGSIPASNCTQAPTARPFRRANGRRSRSCWRRGRAARAATHRVRVPVRQRPTSGLPAVRWASLATLCYSPRTTARRRPSTCSRVISSTNSTSLWMTWLLRPKLGTRPPPSRRGHVAVITSTNTFTSSTFRSTPRLAISFRGLRLEFERMSKLCTCLSYAHVQSWYRVRDRRSTTVLPPLVLPCGPCVRSCTTQC
mmetsp:Transcript_65871/g.130584  ORF Transcript_65871/g.130584 Transcript_65871/m.130584 type:complete len:246 (-) Transcript_65871:23-760(-)